jgi:GNAT superfamily N-acetyltransferase
MLHFTYGPATYAEFHELRRFHYCSNRPTLAQIFAVHHDESGSLAGVIVLSYPVPLCLERHAVFRTGGLRYGEKMRWANANLRTLSRVIVHPRFRGVGLATGLVRYAAGRCTTPYLEARSHLGHAMPIFKRAGMTKVEGSLERPAYYWCAARAFTRAERPSHV